VASRTCGPISGGLDSRSSVCYTSGVEEFSIPDYEEIHGEIGEPRRAWRAWRAEVADEDGKPHVFLASLSQKVGKTPFLWRPREIHVGVCNIIPSKHPDDDTPMEGCRCGIHALDSPLGLEKVGIASNIGPGRAAYVFGEVDLWGKIIEGDVGIKAQFGYPARFYIRWDVKIEVGDSEIDSLLLKDILEQQWGVETKIVVTAVKKDKLSQELVFSEYEPE
jgi:hypothetical protein